MTKLTWRLETTDLSKCDLEDVIHRTLKYVSNTDIDCFFTLSDVWNKLGFKLKKERCGYSGIKGSTLYVLVRMG